MLREPQPIRVLVATLQIRVGAHGTDEHSSHPLVDLSMTIGERKSARPPKICSRHIRKSSVRRLAGYLKVPVIDGVWIFFAKHKGVRRIRLFNVVFLDVFYGGRIVIKVIFNINAAHLAVHRITSEPLTI